MPQISKDKLNALAYDVAIYNSDPSYKKMFGLLFSSLFRFSMSMLKSRELAEEVASDVMLKLWEKRMQLLQIDNIHVYALVIVRNLSLNLVKSNLTGRVVPLNPDYAATLEAALSPEQILINAQNRARLQSSIDALPTRCKLVFKLVKEEGLNYKEVAEVLNISPKTVDAHLVTAMKKLSTSLKSNSFFPA